MKLSLLSFVTFCRIGHGHGHDEDNDQLTYPVDLVKPVDESPMIRAQQDLRLPSLDLDDTLTNIGDTSNTFTLDKYIFNGDAAIIHASGQLGKRFQYDRHAS